MGFQNNVGFFGASVRAYGSNYSLWKLEILPVASPRVTLLVDADVVAYVYSSAAQQNFDWGDGVTSVGVDENYDPFSRAVANIEELKEKLQADEAIVCLSDPTNNWRKTVLPSYKGNRKGPKPEMLMAVKAYLSQEFRTYQRPWLEGDDIMGILSTHPTLIKGKRIIVSIDKDLQQVPGLLFNPDKDTSVRKITPEAGMRFHMYQTLIGDTTDGYTGCPGIGKKTAEKGLVAAEEFSKTSGTPLAEAYWKAVVELYESKGLTEADALIQARVSRMCTHTDYDFNIKRVILWTPPNIQHLPVITAGGLKPTTKRVRKVTAVASPQP